jgi:DNA-binding CsgD family transcriptional regulator
VDLEALFDLLPIGVVVVDGALRLRRANSPALALLERRDALLVAGGRLAAGLPEHDRALERLVRDARAARGDSIRAVLPCARGACQVALSARLLVDSDDDASALVFLSVVEERAVRPPALDGLSRRRREVLECLLAGDRPHAIALTLGLSEHTIRAYVKDLHRHFGAHSRGELLARFILPPA